MRPIAIIIDREYEVGTTPPPDLIRFCRRESGDSQTEAAAAIYRPRYQTWQDWEAGNHPMPAADFELYCRKRGLWPPKLLADPDTSA